MQNFNVVQDPADATGATYMTLEDYELAATADITQKPKPFVPMAMPMRLTDNEKCNTENPKPYCDGSFIDNPDSDIDPLAYGLKDMCVATIEVPTGQNDELKPVCVDDTGLPNLGNTAATRARLGLYSYESGEDLALEGGERVEDIDVDMDAFTVIVAEEDKGLGKFGYKVDADGVFVLDADGYAEECTIVKGDDADPSCQPFDEGKNLTYHSFSMSLTDAVGGTEKNPANVEDTLVENLTHHWNQLNQPEVNWKTGDFYPVMNTADLWGFGDYDFDIWNTEIARRGSLLAQDIDAVGKDGLFAFPTWKQGTMNQGGPADVLARRIVAKDNWKVKDGNPYAFTNVECDEWLYTEGENPYFPDGLCTATPINLSATVPDTAVETDTGNTEGILPVLTEGEGDFLISTVNPILEGKILDDGDDNTTDSNTTKVLTWHSCPAAFDPVSGIETVTCEDDSREDSDSTLADQTWYNPLEVAKGHRGFLDGDMVMLLYAWSPNYRLNTKGNDRYDLYIRRSFDAGQTWTTTPGGGEKDSEGVAYGGDGTVTCETYRSEVTGDSEQVDEPRACSSYEAGAAEQPRNVTQHSSMRTTTLDPRYAMTGSPYGVSIESELFGITPPNYMVGDEVDGEDIRDASRFFIVYETGDNTTAAEGEPEPLDLFYSRAVNYGDDYVVWDDDAELDGESDLCYPSNPHDDIDPDTGVAEELIGSGFCNEFDQMESGTPGLEASESSLQANPGGEFLYGAWTQIMITEEEIGKSGKTRVTVEESDAMARRVWWIDGFTSDEFDWQFGQGTGDGVPAN